MEPDVRILLGPKRFVEVTLLACDKGSGIEPTGGPGIINIADGGDGRPLPREKYADLRTTDDSVPFVW